MKKIFACFLVTAMVVGCGGESVKPPPKTYPVTGIVTYNGEPLKGATVSFWAPNSPRAGAGVTDEKGEFQLQTSEGENTVTVTKIVGSVSALSKDAAKDPAKMAESTAVSPPVKKKASKKDPAPPKPPVPEKYSTVKDSQLKQPVTAKGPNRAELKLTD